MAADGPSEAVYGLKAKGIVEHGSAKLHTVRAQFSGCPESQRIAATREVLIAPSWGDCSLIEQPVGNELIEILIRVDRTVLRLHPMTVRRFPTLVQELKQSTATSLFLSLSIT